MASIEWTPRNLVILLGAINGIGGLIFGYNTGVIAPVLTAMKKDDAELDASSWQQSFLTASILFGAMIGSLFGGSITEIFGKPRSVILVGVLTVFGALGAALFPYLWVIILFREILGVGVGLASVVCPVYVSENAPPQNKGALGAAFQMSVTLGILLAYIVGLIFQNVSYSYHWMIGMGAVPGVIFIGIGFIMPPSRINTDDIGTSTGASPIVLLFTTYSKYLLLGVVLAVVLQLTGINAIIFFAPTIFEEAQMSGDTAQLLATVGVGFWNFIATFGALFLVDRLGRRPLLLGGLVLMTVANFVMGFLFFSEGLVASIFSIIMVFLFIGAFECGIGSLFWPLLTEVFPAEVRDSGASVMNAVQWTFNILLSLFFLPLAENHISVAFWLFAAAGAACFAFLWVFLPETREGSVSAAPKYYVSESSAYD